MGIPISRPLASDEELEALKAVLQSGFWGCGPEVAKFESEFAKFLGVQHCVATNSCTSALHLAGKLINAEPGSEIIVPAITWIATAYLAIYNQLQVVFADVERKTLTISPDDILKKISAQTRAVVVVHHGGNACYIDEIQKICHDHQLILVEDCAHSLGASFNDRLLGTFGDIACFSFNPAKNISTGDGGMLVVQSEELAKRARSLRYFGIDRNAFYRMEGGKYNWQHDILEFGFKYNMNDLVAAIGRVQLRKLNDYNLRRQQAAKYYDDGLGGEDWIELPTARPGATSSNQLYCIKVASQYRDDLIAWLTSNYIDVGVHYKPIYQYSLYNQYRADCPTADEVWKQLISLPIYPSLTISDQQVIIKAIKSFKR